jgi:GTPase
MASVFTYDPDPPRVSSPWILADDADNSPASGASVTQTGLLSEYGVTRLDAEPQTGPIEYKLHLLLRSRRSYVYMSTVNQKRDKLHAQPGDGSAPYSASPASYSASPIPASSSQPRQERLQRLTTQLLWRLQQSSPYHASSSREVKIPKLPSGSADADSPDLYGTQIPGLEESQGALYEIGVSDDGHLVGLAKDELDESIATLRVMAASLGCGVTVLRMVIVGDCEWIEIADLNGNASQGPTQVKRDRLWVAEALITPSTELPHAKDAKRYNESADGTPLESAASTTVPGHGKSTTPQLRVTLTGPIASGKSSLLGTLSTGTLDNGRGKSRLSLLKHRHEMASGMTSSIAQELIGYKERLIFSFSHRNIESWLDIHDYANDGRLVFMSDSGGHPRYRHTVFRGLMNWAPHWMVLCIAADDGETTSRAHDVTSPAPDSGDTDLVKAHLDLSLKLDVPLAIVITKLDLASKVSLQKTMTKILGAIRDADRVPKLLQPDQQPRDQLSEIPQTDWDKVQSFVGNISEHGDLLKHVPIVFTSVLKGVGIGLVHALLASLPLPPVPASPKDISSQAEQPRNLFHIDDTFSLPRSFDDSLANLDGVIVSGHVRLGSFSIGQTIIVGPFSSSHALDRGSGTEYQSSPEGHASPALRAISIGHPNGHKMGGSVSPPTDSDEWQKARIVSIRNLRLPVGTLEAGQVGSIGLVFETDHSDLTDLPDTPQIRRGMVISTPTMDMPDSEIPLHASRGFSAVFEEDSAQFPPSGTLVNVLFACVRTAARVIDVSVQHRDEAGETTEPFDADQKAGSERASSGDTVTKITVELVHSRKWAEPGSSVIIMGNGSHDGSGLQGFVGKITDVMC